MVLSEYLIGVEPLPGALLLQEVEVAAPTGGGYGRPRFRRDIFPDREIKPPKRRRKDLTDSELLAIMAALGYV